MPGKQHPTRHDIKIDDELVKRLPQIPGNALKTFLVLASRATVLGDNSDDDNHFFDALKVQNVVTENDRGRLFCYLPHIDICDLTGLTKNTITSQTDILENLGLIEKRSIPTGRGRGTFNVYFILPTALIGKNNSAKNGTENPKHPVNNRDGNDNNRSKTGTNLILINSDSDDFDLDSILDYFAQQKNISHYHPTAHDRQRLTELRAAGCTTRLMQHAINIAFETRPAGAPPIRQLSYCAPIARKLLAEAATAAAATQHTSPDTPFGDDAPYPLISDTDSLLSHAVDLYEWTFGAPPVEKTLNALRTVVQRYPDVNLLNLAFRRGKKYGAHHLVYIERILENETKPDDAPATEPEESGNPGSSVPPTPPTPPAPPTALQRFWENLLEQIRGQMTRAAFNQWITPAQPIEKTDDKFIIGTKNPYAKDWLDHRLRKIVERAVCTINGAPLAIEFTVI